MFLLLPSFKQGSAFDEKTEDYADLPPNQRRKKLLQKIDLIQTQINQETAVRYVALLNIYSLLRTFDSHVHNRLGERRLLITRKGKEKEKQKKRKDAREEGRKKKERLVRPGHSLMGVSERKKTFLLNSLKLFILYLFVSFKTF